MSAERMITESALFCRLRACSKKKYLLIRCVVGDLIYLIFLSFPDVLSPEPNDTDNDYS